MSMMKTMPKPQHLHVNVRHEDDAFWCKKGRGEI